ncbi:MAG: hypothetical protein IPG50_24420 [Myxococcales bacterium]|nr:hypothetical protein [Myxococcales bacterium]
MPIGSRTKRPIVIALHGAAGDPRGMCLAGRWLFGTWPFVLCPQGERLGDRTFYWGDPKKMRAAIDRIVLLAEAKYPGRIDPESIVWLSHSQAGILGAQTLAVPGIQIRRAVFFEGLPEDAASLRTALERAGTERALFITQHPGGLRRYEAAAAAVRPKVAARAVFPGPYGPFTGRELREDPSRTSVAPRGRRELGSGGTAIVRVGCSLACHNPRGGAMDD